MLDARRAGGESPYRPSPASGATTGVADHGPKRRQITDCRCFRPGATASLPIPPQLPPSLSHVVPCEAPRLFGVARRNASIACRSLPPAPFLDQGSFPPPALPGFTGTTTLSATPGGNDICLGGAVFGFPGSCHKPLPRSRSAAISPCSSSLYLIRSSLADLRSSASDRVVRLSSISHHNNTIVLVKITFKSPVDDTFLRAFRSSARAGAVATAMSSGLIPSSRPSARMVWGGGPMIRLVKGCVIASWERRHNLLLEGLHLLPVELVFGACR